MKKKLENYILNKVIGGAMPVLSDGQTYYYNDGHKIVRSPEYVGTLKPTQNDKVKAIKENFFGDIDTHMVELPPVKEIEEHIRACKTRDRIGVRISADSPFINARWLKDAMKALSAKVMYVSNQCSPRVSPVWLFEDDNLQSENCVMILPIGTWSSENETGYRVCPTR